MVTGFPLTSSILPESAGIRWNPPDSGAHWRATDARFLAPEDVPLAVEFRRRSGDVILSRGYPVSRPFPES